MSNAASTHWDYDMQLMDREHHKDEIMKLRTAIRRVIGQRGDDLCWRDIYTELASLLPEKPEVPHTPPKEIFLKNCARFEESMRDYKTAGSVWIVSLGDGEDGNEWQLLGIYTTKEKAEAAKTDWESRRGYSANDVEEYKLDEVISQ